MGKLDKVQTSNYLTLPNVLTGNQYIFRYNKGTSDALFDITKEILSWLGVKNAF